MMLIYTIQGPVIKLVKTIYTPHTTISSLCIDYTTNKFAVTVGQDKRLIIWNIHSGKLMRTYKQETSELYKADIDPSSMYICVCTFDKYIRVYDFFSGEEVCSGGGHCELITSVR